MEKYLENLTKKSNALLLDNLDFRKIPNFPDWGKTFRAKKIVIKDPDTVSLPEDFDNAFPKCKELILEMPNLKTLPELNLMKLSKFSVNYKNNSLITEIPDSYNDLDLESFNINLKKGFELPDFVLNITDDLGVGPDTKLPRDFDKDFHLKILRLPRHYKYLPPNFDHVPISIFVDKYEMVYDHNVTQEDLENFINEPEKTIDSCDTKYYWVTDEETYDISRKYKYYAINNEKISERQMCNKIMELSPSPNWKDETENYISNLSDYQKNLMTIYTHVGDKIINTFYREGVLRCVDAIRTGGVFPYKIVLLHILKRLKKEDGTLKIGKHSLIKDDFFEKYYGIQNNSEKIESLMMVTEKIITSKSSSKEKNSQDIILINLLSDFAIGFLVAIAINDFIEIFVNCPPLEKDVILFRGIKTNFFIGNKEIKSLGFSSTSNDPDVALEFMGDSGYLWKIFVPKGVKCLPIPDNISVYEGESEILFPPGTILNIKNCSPISDKLKYRTRELCEILLKENIEFLNLKYYEDLKNW